MYSLKSTIIVFALLIFIISCTENTHTSSIRIAKSNTIADSVALTELMTDQPLGQIKIKENNTLAFETKSPTISLAKVSNAQYGTMLVHSPGEIKDLTIDSLTITTNSVADSIVNYLHSSGNDVLASYGGLIFSEGNEKEVLAVFDSLLTSRKELIKNADLRHDIKELLTYHNKSRIYNFLFYYGRMIYKLPPDDSFFDFTQNIDYNYEPYFRTSPHVVLYKLEIDYLNKHKTLEDVLAFTDFIDSTIQNKDDAAFLRAFYIKEIIELPQYWEKHVQVFNSIELKKLLEIEKNNTYAYLFKSGSKSYFSTFAGEPAQHFDALTSDSSIVNSSQYGGKLLVIDAWATWCGPCLQQKPNFNAIAEKYKNDNRIEFLSVSTDLNFSKWQNFVIKKNSPLEEWNVSGALNSKFEQAYNVQSIPRYIMINTDGKIIDADMPDPSIAMERMIDEQLKKVTP